ncbi:response regulator [Nakamurella sp. YIM 132087]|uniref:Transcriptional regulatory protein n=1 Tax=Nakamurella alba TaxID=2665158 RepID=A0A7K1FIX4_9ACTN|nr:response regulator [Nakamurella alba]MTD14058.1 response regulator [Nakamurella alba]
MSGTAPDTGLRVLVVEDDRLVAQAHADLVARIAGFRPEAVVHSARDARRRLAAAADIDLVLLDLNLPDEHGLDLCRSLRTAGVEVDVIAVTSQRDVHAVRTAVSLGIVQYVLKPFTFRMLADKLGQYRRFRDRLDPGGADLEAQSEVDRALAALRPETTGTLPTGLTESTLATIAQTLRRHPRSSAAEVAGHTGTSRATARRYLEHLVAVGRAEREQRHVGSGRPEIEYLPA